MDNFFSAPVMKNSMNVEDHEHDLTLSLRCGSPERITIQSSPITLPDQTNISLMELQMSYPNYLVSSSNHNINPFLVSCSNHRITTNLLGSSSNHNPNPYPNFPCAAAANNNYVVDVNATPTSVLTRSSLRGSSQRRSQGKSETVPAPFPWATDRRATVHNRKYLLQNNVVAISGRFRCKRCGKEFEMTLNLEEKVKELRKFIEKERGSMHDRAPATWVNPVLAKCVHCGRENSAKPILGETKKRAINWLFLLLGQMLGFCSLDQLKYFCKHTNNHRTGAKDRLLYLAYMTLSKQLVPEWFD